MSAYMPDTPLIAAAKTGDIDKIRAALAVRPMDASWDRDKHNNNAAHVLPYGTAPAKSIVALELLRQNGVDLGARNEWGHTPLHVVMGALHSKKLFRPAGHELQEPLPLGLHGKESSDDISGYGTEELRQILTIFKEAKVNLNAQDLRDKNDPQKTLSDEEPPIFELRKEFATPSHLKVMKEFGIRFDLADSEGRALAHLWAASGNIDALKFLKDNVSINVVDTFGNTPFHSLARAEAMRHAAPEHLEDMVMLMMEGGIDPSAKNHARNPRTALDILNGGSESDNRLATQLEAVIHKCQATLDARKAFAATQETPDTVVDGEGKTNVIPLRSTGRRPA